ncbi:MAG: DUF835 domain-containing protein [Thermoplasmata archaeon]
MSAPDRRNGTPAPPSDAPPADEEYVRGYAAGYEEGLRNSLRETLEHISHGHTPQEIRMLTASRLARLPEEVDLKRKSLLSPPQRPAWGSLLRPPAPARAWAGAAPAASAPPFRLLPGRSLLVREERPIRAVEILRANALAFPRLAVVSLRPPEVPGLPAGHRLDLVLGGSGTPDDPEQGRLTPGEISGRLRDPTESKGGALVYVDALEFLATEHSLETTIKFVHWLVTQAQETGSALLVSFDPRSLDVRDVSRLERAFESVL